MEKTSKQKQKEYLKRYYEANREKIKNRSQKYYWDNRAKVLNKAARRNASKQEVSSVELFGQ